MRSTSDAVRKSDGVLLRLCAIALTTSAWVACAEPTPVEDGGRDGATSPDATLGAPDGGPSVDADIDRDGAVPFDAGVAPDAAPPPPPRCETRDCGSVDSATTSRGVPQALDACAFGLRLQAPLAEGEALADALIARMSGSGAGTHRSLAEVSAELNRTGRPGLGAETQARLAGLEPSGFRWNTGDDAVSYWYPQGITGSADAGDPGGRWLIVSWYHKTDERPTRGVRISLIDADPSAPRYRHLLLVDPYEGAGGADFGPAEYDTASAGALHAGGIVWVGDRLYVADTAQGLRVYDLGRIIEVSHTNDNSRIGVSASRSDAHGYRYVVPRIGRWRRAPGSCAARFSFAGLGEAEGSPVLATGNYVGDGPSGRVMAWPLDGDDLEVDAEGISWSVAAMMPGQTRMQGALYVDGAWYLSCSSQESAGLSDGRLYRVELSGTTSVAWPFGPEDLYRDGLDRVWTPTEHPNRRELVAIPRPR